MLSDARVAAMRVGVRRPFIRQIRLPLALRSRVGWLQVPPSYYHRRGRLVGLSRLGPAPVRRLTAGVVTSHIAIARRAAAQASNAAQRMCAAGHCGPGPTSRRAFGCIVPRNTRPSSTGAVVMPGSSRPRRRPWAAVAQTTASAASNSTVRPMETDTRSADAGAACSSRHAAIVHSGTTTMVAHPIRSHSRRTSGYGLAGLQGRGGGGVEGEAAA